MEKIKNISLQDLALRVIRGEFGNGNQRKARLGYLYPVVQNLVNKKLSSSVQYVIDDSLIEDLAKKAMDGIFGSVNDLKKNLDYIYPKVQAKMNEIAQKEMKNKTIDEIAYEVIKGKYGNAEYRKNLLGDLYEKVEKKVNEILEGLKKKDSNNEKSEPNSKNNEIQIENKKEVKTEGLENDLTIEELSNKVIRGEYGNGEVRKKKLGGLYSIVQNRVNEKLGSAHRHDINEESIENLAKRVIKGEFGNGEERKKKLRALYPFVQNKVNQILGNPTVYEEKPIPNYIKLNNH